MKHYFLQVAVISSLLLLATACKDQKTKVVRQTIIQEQPTAASGGQVPGGLSAEQDPLKPDGEGQATGGGSFGDESSEYILNEAINDLTTRLKNIQDPIFADLPEGWSKERIIKVLQNTRRSKNKPLDRYKRELMFNYDIDDETGEPYIEALRLFYSSHASLPVNHMSAEEFYPIVAEVKMKLMHEVAHHLGLGLKEELDTPEARTFARDVIDNLHGALLQCVSRQEIELSEPYLRMGLFERMDPSCQVIPEKYDSYKKVEILQGEEYESRRYMMDLRTRLSYAVLIDRGTGRASTWFPMTTGAPSFENIFEESKEIPDAQKRLWSAEPNFEIQTGRDEQLDNALNALRYSDGRHSLNMEKNRNYFNSVQKTETGTEVYGLVLEDLDVRKSSLAYLRLTPGVGHPSGDVFYSQRELYLPVSIETLSETIEFTPESSEGSFKVVQVASIICEDREVPIDFEMEVEMDCEANPIEPVSVTDYLK